VPSITDKTNAVGQILKQCCESLLEMLRWSACFETKEALLPRKYINIVELSTTKSPKNKSAEPAQGRAQKSVREPTHEGAEANMMFQSTIGNRVVGRFLQAKLKVNQPGDKYEQEADRVADLVMRMPAPVKPSTGVPPSLQRKCAACASSGGSCLKCAEKEDEIMQGKPLAAQITPLVQRQVMEKPEENEDLLQAKNGW
jgi:hypothetical protein